MKVFKNNEHKLELVIFNDSGNKKDEHDISLGEINIVGENGSYVTTDFEPIQIKTVSKICIIIWLYNAKKFYFEMTPPKKATEEGKMFLGIYKLMDVNSRKVSETNMKSNVIFYNGEIVDIKLSSKSIFN